MLAATDAWQNRSPAQRGRGGRPHEVRRDERDEQADQDEDEREEGDQVAAAYAPHGVRPDRVRVAGDRADAPT